MSKIKSIQKSQKFEIRQYQKPSNIHDLHDTHVPYSGSPIKHPFDKKKIILIADPYSSDSNYLEFNTEDISYVEELQSIVNTEGESAIMARMWVKKKSIGIKCMPFFVERTALP